MGTSIRAEYLIRNYIGAELKPPLPLECLCNIQFDGPPQIL